MRWRNVLLFACAAVLCPLLRAQAVPPTQRMPPNYRGVWEHIDGVFVTPVPGAPFTANVRIVSHNKLPDGSERVVTTINHIARSSSGRIRNERRALVSTSFKGEPRLLSAHIYDPSTRQNIYTEPMTRIARMTILPQPERTPTNFLPPAQQRVPPGVTQSSLGTQVQDDLELQGTRKTRVVPADASGTGQPVTITDDYWYSPALSIYVIIRHDDPRSGEQIVAVSQIERGEPAAELLTVPDDYKVVDETPPPPVRRGPEVSTK